MKVLEQFNLRGRAVVATCELFPDSDITDKIKTNIGEFKADAFVVDTPKNCFSPAKTRDILFKEVPKGKKLTSIEFV